MNDKKPLAKVYIDGANMFYTQKKLSWFFDWQKIKELLQKDREIIEFRYYTGIKQSDERMNNFLRYLDAIGFVPVTKKLKIIKVSKDHPAYQLHNYSEIYKSNFDVEMTVDILLDRTQLDEIIILSGDSDFQYLVKRLKDLGKNVIVYSSRKTISWELKLEVSRYFYLEDVKEQICRK